MVSKSQELFNMGIRQNAKKKNEAGNKQQNPSLIHRAKHFKPGEEGNRKITPEGNNNTLNPKV